MKKIFGALVALVIIAGVTVPARAQFADQSTWIATPGGTANAITLAVANWVRNLSGVPIRFLPTADNTGATTVVVNGVGSAVAVMKKTNAGIAALTGGELRSGQWATIGFDGTQWILDDPLGKYTDASTLANSALSFGQVVNLQINATVGTNALTIALKTSAGADATATTPILIPFRDATIANGGPKVVALSGALSFTIASGSTIGCSSGVMCRLWIVAICSTGLECTNSAGSDVVGLCAFNTVSGTNIAPINEAALQTSASGTSGGNSAQTYYCNISAVTARAIRILGYVDISEVTAGTWASGPIYTQLFGPGIKKPGDVVQVINTTTGTAATGSTAVTGGNTLPTSSQGDQYMSLAVVPTAAANIIEVEWQAVLHTSSTNWEVSFLLQDSTANALAAIYSTTGQGTEPAAQRGFWSLIANQTTSTTFKVRGGSSSGTTTFNGKTAASLMGGVMNSFMRIIERQSALEPANDNAARRMTG